MSASGTAAAGIAPSQHPDGAAPAVAALSAPLQLRELAALVALFAAGFVCMAVLLHLSIRDPLHLYAQVRSEKLALLDEWKGRASSAAFGSSHVDNGFDPRAFDRELSGTAAATTSLNLGISGGSQTEQATVAAAFLESLPPAAPGSPSRFVLLELTAGANFTNDHLFHPRAINIYNLDAIRLAVNDSGIASVGWRRALGRSGFALAAGLLHYLNVGMLSSCIFPPPLNSALLSSQTAFDRRGLTPNQAAPKLSPDTLAVQNILARQHSSQATAGEVLEGHRLLLADLAAAARRKKVRLLYFVAPKLSNLSSYPIFPAFAFDGSSSVPILNVTRPEEHPELYRPELWHDPNHLTESGAAVFSRLLADELLERLRLYGATRTPAIDPDAKAGS